MARKRIKDKKARVSSKKTQEAKEEPKPYLESETIRGIVVVGLFALAGLSILSLLRTAGQVGVFLEDFLKLTFGWGRFVFPAILIILGYVLIFPDKYKVKGLSYFGLFLFILSYSGLLHLFIGLPQAVSAVGEGEGGGYVGLILSYPLQKIMGPWATLVVLIALLIISVLILFNISLNKLSRSGNILGRVYWKLKSLFARRLPGSEEEIEAESFKSKTLETAISKEGKEREIVLQGKRQLRFFPQERLILKKIDLPIDLLEISSTKPSGGDIKLNMEKIQKTLENFGIKVEMGDANIGPTVTQYTLRPAEGIKLSQITTLHNDLALALAAHPIRIEAPIPGKSLVGVEVPNQSIAIVNLREILESESFKKRKSKLTLPLGEDVAGQAYVADLDIMPHLLIAGATGSGKSVCINSIIVGLLYQNSPSDLKFILIDPKRVELVKYDGVPHLLTPVITETDKIINALKWIVIEMDRRFHLFSTSGKRDIHQYNSTSSEKLPFIIVIIDELADLMSVAAHEVEGAITRLAQMARAVGIHLIVSTQRPSVDVITGLIKANITSRIAFDVASIMDSRTILDFSGAEKLLGRGDMLYISASLSRPKRIQGAYVSDREIDKVVDYLKGKGQPEYQEEITEKSVREIPITENDFEEDELLPEVKKIILEADKASASLLQRRLRIGYARAARLLDILEEKGIIGPADGAKPREVLIKKEDEFDTPD